MMGMRYTKKHSIILSVLLVLVVMISGCTNIANPFVVSYTSPEGGDIRDVVAIKDVYTLPRSPVFAGSDVVLFFMLENKDNPDSIESANNVVVELYNPNIFTPRPPSICGSPGQCTMIPGEQKQIRFELTAPTNDQIAGLKTPLELYLKASYKFSSSHTFPILVVTMGEIEMMQMAGKQIQKTLTPVSGNGPIQISAELTSKELFIIAGQSASVRFMIEDKGSGNLKGSNITKNSLTIDFSSIPIVGDIKAPYNFDNCPGRICTNTNEDIYLFSGKSSPMVFRFSTLENGPPEMEYRIISKTKIDYTYELRDSIKIEVVPES